ncbi:Alpha/Beta hydrolase protein [Gorgonomyces haynaldii]|nr:Alpha/Beta hydrolase protein [Gorgonomyces haynaldii]
MVCVGGIPVDFYGLERIDKQKPVSILFMMHGRLESKQKYQDFCSKIQHGIVVLFDQRNHGERTVDEKRNRGWPENKDHAIDMYSTVLGMAQDVSFLITVLPAYLQVTVKSFGVCGVSLGGHASFMALCHEPRLSFCCNIIGGGDYRLLMTDRAKASGLPLPPDSQEYISEHLYRLIEQMDPINNIPNFKSKDILFLGGQKDTLVPPSVNDVFFEKLNKVCALQVYIDPESGHRFSDPMRERAIQYLHEKLQ